MRRVRTEITGRRGFTGIRELRRSAEDAELLGRIYRDILTPSFPDADELETLENMTAALMAAPLSDGSVCHVAVCWMDGRVAGVCVSDYFPSARSGIVEYIAVPPGFRGCGVSKALMDFTWSLFGADASPCGGSPLLMAAETNDPAAPGRGGDGMDPFLRLEILGGYGFRRLCMPYVQPALAPGKEPVSGMFLLAFTADPLPVLVPSRLIVLLLESFLRLAVRIGDPVNCPDMAPVWSFLNSSQDVALEPLPGAHGRVLLR